MNTWKALPDKHSLRMLAEIDKARKVSKDFSKVADIPHEYLLITDSQDIVACLQSIGRETERGNVGCLFAKIGEGEYTSVYYCERSVPYLDASVVRLL